MTFYLLTEDGSRLLTEDGSGILTEAGATHVYLPPNLVRPLIWLYTIAGARLLPLQDLGNIVVEDRLGGLETLTFTIRAADPKAFAVKADVFAEYGGRLYRIEEPRDYREGARAMIEVYAEARWMDLGKRVNAGSFAVLGQTALAGLTMILAGTGWTGAVDPIDVAVYSMEDLDASTLSLLRRWAGIVGRELEWDTTARTVTLVDTIGDDRGIGFRWGHNLRSVSRRYRPPVATRLYPFGANNLEISDVNPTGANFVEDYSWYTAQGLTLAEARSAYRKDQVWVDTRFLLKLNLYDAALRRLAALAQPTVAYELAVADFATLTGSTADDVAIGDTVRVRDATFDIDVATRVVRLVRYPLHPQSNEVELDYLQPGLSEVEDSETSRSIDYGQLAILVDQNIAAVTVAAAVVPYATIQATSTGEATFVLGGTFKGTATGTGTVRHSFAVNGVDTGPVFDFAFVAGQVEFSWPTFVSGVDASSTASLSWRARVIAGTGTIALAAGEGRGWAISRGVVGIGVNLSPNQSIEETLELVLLAIADAAIVEIIAVATTVRDITAAESKAYKTLTANDNAAGATPTVTLI